MWGEAPLKIQKNVRKFEEISAFVLADKLKKGQQSLFEYEVHSDFIYSLIVSDWKLERN